MSDQRRVPQRRVLGAKRADEPGERRVLRGLVRNVVGAFELHAYRKVVAAGSPEVLRLAGMPGALLEADILRQRAVPRDQDVRRHLEPRDRGEVRVRPRVEPVDEERVDPRPAEASRRKADAVQHDQIERSARRPGVAVRRRHLPRAAYPAAVDDHRHATLKTRTRPRIEPHYTTPSPRLAGRSAQSAGTPSSENADVGPPHYTPVSRPRPRRGSRAADGARNEVP